MRDCEPLIFDGHNDLLLRLFQAGGVDQAQSVRAGREGAIDLPKAKAGGFAGGFFAVYIPSPGNFDHKLQEMNKPAYDMGLPEPIDWQDAMPVAAEQMAILFELERQGSLKICRSVAEIRDAMARGQMAAILHMEGAEAIDADLHMLDVFYAAGLRSLGPVWSRSTIFGHGVPLRFPSSPDIGDGLSDHGLRLVKRCNELGILIDLSHLNEAGFWDVARHSDAPLVATHSNAHALSASARNLTDDQLRAIADSDGMVGLNFAVAFLREDGRMASDVPLDQMLRHLDHLIGILGEDRVGFGSDYDGAMVPEALRSVADLPNLRAAMRAHGYDDTLMDKLCHKNWLSVLDRIWGS